MLGWLERHQYSILLLAGLALALVAGWRWLAPGSRPADIVLREGSGLADGAPIQVHVAGAVIAPGVFDLREGDRVAEALSAAGGPGEDADLDALNLARRLRDGEQLLVPTQTVPKTPRPRATPLAADAKLDINTATTAQLDQLPGIGEVYARRIVDSRLVDGPFTSTQQLVDRRVLPRATYDKLRDRLLALTP